MTVEAVDGAVVDAVRAACSARLGGAVDSAFGEFLAEYYRWVPAHDLLDRTPENLAGAALHQWESASRREPGEVSVEVYNPEPERDGWSSPYTVAEIITDDMPFLVDSVSMEIIRQGFEIELVIHPLVQGRRHDAESVIHVEVRRERDPARLEALDAGLRGVLEAVHRVVRDREPMTAHARELAESYDFLAWLAADNFTFLGYREYVLEGRTLEAVEGTGLGILSGPARAAELSDRALALARGPDPLVLTKARGRARVHRPARMDYVGVKRFAADGSVTGERRFIGLYTAAARRTPPDQIPVVREKVARIMAETAFHDDSHDWRRLTEILASLPRELLIQADYEELFTMAVGLLGVGERPQVRLFTARDPLDRFLTCVLCLPRDRFTTSNARHASEILSRAFGGDEVDWNLVLDDSPVARLDLQMYCPDGVREADLPTVEREIAAETRPWGEALRTALIAEEGEERGTALYAEYAAAFPPGYWPDVDPASALDDIERIGQLQAQGGAILHVYRDAENARNPVRCRLLSLTPAALSDLVPTFEHMGTQVGDERFYEIHPAGGNPVWIYDIGLRCHPADLERAGDEFAATFLDVWSGALEDDALNTLVMRAGLTGRQISVLRAIVAYLRQAAIPFSNAYMVATLVRNPEVSAKLVRLFEARFDPDFDPDAQGFPVTDALRSEIGTAIDGVDSLDADRILSSVLAVTEAMLRTNYFREPAPEYLSFKLDAASLDLLPLPRPRYEIFVCSPRVEGIHLRGGRVARGGLRWSDRREDFRTEVLGLMKAQMVKNSLIVPVGSKGGFVLKRAPAPAEGREALQAEGIECYKTFLRGLLDVTDNYAGDSVVAPHRVVRYDDDDPYLVVAADKGTATFSDIANDIAIGYGFWLGDAFASGGSHGYDHKAMGITARGAWESVKRHFRELGIDSEHDDFTVVGIGDMSGDVFGNGMLRSEHIRLVAAFNHAHIFVDPQPDAAVSFAERRRLFELPRSGWSDYDTGLISEGGGVWPRTAKSIPVSPQMAEALGVPASARRLSPTELISAILRAPVDLLYNGGVGTYVKAATETNSAVGDRSNDAVRINGAQLRCRVVAEGGNLGVTQRGRIEYALSGGPGQDGGMIFTDAVDNVAGVNCSDHEVNIKILLDDLIAGGEVRSEDRDAVLVSMTDAVAEEVLYDSFVQTQALSIAVAKAAEMREVYGRQIRWLGVNAGLDRDIEVLPSDEALAQRRSEGRSLVAPELCVLMAQCKIALSAELLESDLPDDPYMVGDLERYFPVPLGTGAASADRAPEGAGGAERYTRQIHGHRVRRELVATIVANQIVDRAGISFAFRLAEETGLGAAQLARAFSVAREVFAMREFWDGIEDLGGRVSAETERAMLNEGRVLVDRATRWLGRMHTRSEIDVTATAEHFAAGVRQLYAAIPEVLPARERETYDARLRDLLAADVVPELARRTAAMPALLSAFDLVEDALASGCSQALVTRVYFGMSDRLELGWLRDRVLDLPRADRWQSLARSALRDDLHELHRDLTREILDRCAAKVPSDPEEAAQIAAATIDAWLAENEGAVARADGVLRDVQASNTYDATTLPVVLRELKNLTPQEAA
ncbi:MAG: NAD-glutamate dehydrogenase [Conexibacteraceae bacterium]|nr:NAD-glutamate dehydrogenase [Conexibacteraceae bacterium]